MSTVSEYNSYIASYASRSNSTSNSTAADRNNSLISSEGFLRLLAVQLSNQDCLNPTQDTEFISQMAQFTSLQAMQEVSKAVNLQYNASLAGKTVTVQGMDTNGRMYAKTGVVESVYFSSDETILVIDGRSYPVSDLIEVVATKQSETEPKQDETTEPSQDEQETTETEKTESV